MERALRKSCQEFASHFLGCRGTSEIGTTGWQRWCSRCRQRILRRQDTRVALKARRPAEDPALDRGGLVTACERLEAGNSTWPAVPDGFLTLSRTQVGALFTGCANGMPCGTATGGWSISLPSERGRAWRTLGKPNDDERPLALGNRETPVAERAPHAFAESRAPQPRTSGKPAALRAVHGAGQPALSLWLWRRFRCPDGWCNAGDCTASATTGPTGETLGLRCRA